MKLLLDTHIFIWWNQDPLLLPLKIYALCMDPGNSLFLSVASIWEMQIKYQQGKLKFNEPLKVLIDRQLEKTDLELLPVSTDHIYSVGNLPLYHKDPFDRIIIAQSIHEGMKLVSVDSIFEKYGISTTF